MHKTISQVFTNTDSKRLIATKKHIAQWLRQECAYGFTLIHEVFEEGQPTLIASIVDNDTLEICRSKSALSIELKGGLSYFAGAKTKILCWQKEHLSAKRRVSNRARQMLQESGFINAELPWKSEAY